ncbi:hypothetical protein QBC47DRAFT_63934 [Echria macrotheca]|uniref:Uncharacterized protein n=1 Tax=Echria macrotheca TaxID=438768 RepID=A0AAJ0F269_9PEZI|nr:hypothetical protein QBC47DRAFT_63934 [Echria macrotheca]
MELASLYFGLFLAVFVFTLAKVVDQTRIIWRRTHTLIHAYLCMIWVETWVNFVFALVTFLFLNGIIHPSLGFYIGSVLLWAIQTQLLSQIIANRVSLIMSERRLATKLKCGLFLATACINIAVACIWIPAQLPSATAFQIKLNHAFEYAEKSFFLIVDLSLNLLFLYLVRFQLIANGLSKYWQLYHFNAGIVVISTSMDALLLGFLSLPDPYLYVQFAPLAYMVKLQIELTMAVLIGKVVKKGNSRHDGLQASSSHKTDFTHGDTKVVITSGHNTRKPGNSFFGESDGDIEARGSTSGSQSPLSAATENGIMKTVEMVVLVDENADARKAKRDSKVFVFDGDV